MRAALTLRAGLRQTHCVFSTKGRKPLIHDELRPALWAYMSGIARKHKMKALAVGGTSDHVHLLLLIPADLSLSKALHRVSEEAQPRIRRALRLWIGMFSRPYGTGGRSLWCPCPSPSTEVLG